MGRWLWRGTLALVALLVLLGAAPTGKAFTLACDGSLEGLRYLRNVRSQIAEATAPPPEPIRPAASIWLRQVAGKIAVGAITGFLHVKESDAVAYPAHVAVAYVLDGAGCGEDAVRIQWLKAALHASRAGQPEQIARALDARTADPDDRTQLRGVVQVWSEQRPWSVPMRRLRDALDALST